METAARTEDSELDRRFDAMRRSRTFERLRAYARLGSRSVLDIGCEHGEHLAHFGAGCVGITTTPEEVTAGTARGLRVVRANAERLSDAELTERYQAIWANNLFEHLRSPRAFLIGLRRVAAVDAVLVLGVPVVPGIASLMRLRKFRGALSVAHINFFTRETLRLTVERAGWRVRELRPFIIGWEPIHRLLGYIAPHLYVIAEFDPRFAYHDKKIREWEHDS